MDGLHLAAGDRPKIDTPPRLVSSTLLAIALLAGLVMLSRWHAEAFAPGMASHDPQEAAHADAS